MFHLWISLPVPSLLSFPLLVPDSLPAEYSLFVEAFKKTPNVSWIMKPIGSSQGKGIFLFEKLHQIAEWKNDLLNKFKPDDTSSKAEKYIVQRYLSDPLLIGGKKFDLRMSASGGGRQLRCGTMCC
jgi:tubulin polyglutamylase TTLL9